MYEEHCDTWDAEARDAWPVVVEHASLAPSTIGKITNHYITRHMVNNGVTWAHVVALRIMYEKQLYKSRKMMRLIRDKYPNANFEAFSYSEDYKLSFKAETAREAQERAVQNTPAVDSNVQRRQGDGNPPQLTKTPANNHHREMSRGAVEFLSEGNSSEDEPLMWHSSKKTKASPVQKAASRKQATANNTRNEGGVVPQDRRSKRPRHAARDTAGVSPRAGEVKERSDEEQQDTIDAFDKFMSALDENTKATRENIRATEKNTKATEENTRATEENTRAIKETRARNKVVLKKATKA